MIIPTAERRRLQPPDRATQRDHPDLGVGWPTADQDVLQGRPVPQVTLDHHPGRIVEVDQLRGHSATCGSPKPRRLSPQKRRPTVPGILHPSSLDQHRFPDPRNLAIQHHPSHRRPLMPDVPLGNDQHLATHQPGQPSPYPLPSRSRQRILRHPARLGDGTPTPMIMPIDP